MWSWPCWPFVNLRLFMWFSPVTLSYRIVYTVSCPSLYTQATNRWRLKSFLSVIKSLQPEMKCRVHEKVEPVILEREKRWRKRECDNLAHHLHHQQCQNWQSMVMSSVPTASAALRFATLGRQKEDLKIKPDFVQRRCNLRPLTVMLRWPTINRWRCQQPLVIFLLQVPRTKIAYSVRWIFIAWRSGGRNWSHSAVRNLIPYAKMTNGFCSLVTQPAILKQVWLLTHSLATLSWSQSNFAELKSSRLVFGGGNLYGNNKNILI